MAELNALIAAGDAVDDGRVITGRVITGRAQTVGDAFTAEAPALQPMPAEAFDASRLLVARVDARSRVCVRQNYYSVPARYVGRRLPVRLGASTIEAYDGARPVAVHARATGRHLEVLVLDHYLEVLTRKPGALPGATALAQAKAAGVFTETHQAFWDAARRSRGDAAGTRALIEMLLGHRTLPAEALLAAMRRAVDTGVIDPQVVLIDARRQTATAVAPVVEIGALARYDRATPTLAGYDALISGAEASA
jgi:hypothetical protein